MHANFGPEKWESLFSLLLAVANVLWIFMRQKMVTLPTVKYDNEEPFFPYLQRRNAKMARRSPNVPQTAPAMVPKCSSRLMRITESLCSVLRGANVLIASQPRCNSTCCIWLNAPKCINLSPTWDRVPAWTFRSYTLLVVRLFKYIWKKEETVLDSRSQGKFKFSLKKKETSI